MVGAVSLSIRLNLVSSLASLRAYSVRDSMRWRRNSHQSRTYSAMDPTEKTGISKKVVCACFGMCIVPQGQHMGVEAAHVIRVVLEARVRENVDPLGCRAPLTIQGELVPQVSLDKKTFSMAKGSKALFLYVN